MQPVLSATRVHPGAELLIFVKQVNRSPQLVNNFLERSSRSCSHRGVPYFGQMIPGAHLSVVNQTHHSAFFCKSLQISLQNSIKLTLEIIFKAIACPAKSKAARNWQPFFIIIYCVLVTEAFNSTRLCVLLRFIIGYRIFLPILYEMRSSATNTFTRYSFTTSALFHSKQIGFGFYRYCQYMHQLQTNFGIFI